MASGYESTIWNYFVDKIGNEYGVAGLMGNLYAESGLYPNNLENTYNSSFGMTDEEYTSAVDNGTYTNFVNDSAGYGIAQWTFSARKQELYDLFISGAYNSISSIGLQCDHLWNELNTSYSGVLAVLKSATTIREASDCVLHDFENPLVQDEEVETVREQYSITFYEQFQGTYEGGGTDTPVTTNSRRNRYNFILFNQRRKKQWIGQNS